MGTLGQGALRDYGRGFEVGKGELGPKAAQALSSMSPAWLASAHHLAVLLGLPQPLARGRVSDMDQESWVSILNLLPLSMW